MVRELIVCACNAQKEGGWNCTILYCKIPSQPSLASSFKGVWESGSLVELENSGLTTAPWRRGEETVFSSLWLVDIGGWEILWSGAVIEIIRPTDR